jgi:hypothetical protein
MSLDVLQREFWSGVPRKQGDTFRLSKGTKTAECELWSHLLGWELRLMAAGEFLQSQVCRSQEEVVDTSDQWKVAMINLFESREHSTRAHVPESRSRSSHHSNARGRMLLGG